MELNVWALVVGILLLYAWVFVEFPPFTNALLVLGLVLLVIGILIKPQREKGSASPTS